MEARFTDSDMKNIFFFKKDFCQDHLFTYPCKDSNSKYLEKQTVAIFDDSSTIQSEWFIKNGAEVLLNPSNGVMTKVKIAVVMPNKCKDYYGVLDYYIHLLQKLVNSMKSKHEFRHLIVVLPAKSDECCTEFARMAHYAIYGLIKGLGKMYAPYGLLVNGLILNEIDITKNLEEWILYLASDNSCNTVGQVFKL